MTPRKDPIPNQDINRLSTKKDKSLPPQLAKISLGFKLLINEAHDHTVQKIILMNVHILHILIKKIP